MHSTGVTPTTVTDVQGWEAHVEELLEGHPGLLARFQEDPPPIKNASLGIVITNYAIQRRMDLKIKNLEAITHDLRG
jgi:hypothetical protein